MNDFKVYKKYFNTLSIPSEHFSMHLRGREMTVEPNALIPPERLKPRLHSAFLPSAFVSSAALSLEYPPAPTFVPERCLCGAVRLLVGCSMLSAHSSCCHLA